MLETSHRGRGKILQFVLSAGVSVLFLVPFYSVSASVENAVEVARLRLDAETITKGYTVESPDKNLKVGVVDGAVTVPVEVALKKIPVSHFPDESETSKKVSDILEYDIRYMSESGETEPLKVLEKPVYIAIKYNIDSINKKVVHYWNKPTQEWVPLPSTTDFENKLVRAVSYFPYSRLAVFDDEYVYEGPASWYVSGFHCDCAASPIYMRKTKLKVTNISARSPKRGASMVIRVNDYGPDPNIHPDRPIDLDKVAFAKLASSVGSGLMMVRVEPVDINNAKKYSWVLESEASRLAVKSGAKESETAIKNSPSEPSNDSPKIKTADSEEKSTEQNLGISEWGIVDLGSENVGDNDAIIKKSDIKFKSDFDSEIVLNNSDSTGDSG